jgi:hypothetical protein
MAKIAVERSTSPWFRIGVVPRIVKKSPPWPLRRWRAVHMLQMDKLPRGGASIRRLAPEDVIACRA